MNHEELFADPLFQLFCRLARLPVAGTGGAMGAAIRNESIRHYCAEHLAEHARLPADRHRVPLRWKGSTGSFECTFPADELSRCLSVAFTEIDAGIQSLGKRAAVLTAREGDRLKAVEVSHRWVAGAKPTICSLPGEHPYSQATAKTILVILRRVPLQAADGIGLDSADETPLISLTLKFISNDIAFHTKEWAPPGDWLHWYVDWGNGSTPVSSPVRHLFLKVATRFGRAAYELRQPIKRPTRTGTDHLRRSGNPGAGSLR